MKIKKFLKNTKKVLGIKPSKEDISKIEKLEKMIAKLEKKRINLEKTLQDKALNEDRKKDIQEELDIYTMQINY